MSSFHCYCLKQFKVIPLACTLHTRNLPNFMRRPTRVDDAADNADITQLQLITIDY